MRTFINVKFTGHTKYSIKYLVISINIANNIKRIQNNFNHDIDNEPSS